MNTVSSDPVVLSRTASLAIAAARSSQRGFWALIATQFQGAFSDNILRNLLLSIDRRDEPGEERAGNVRLRCDVSLLGAVPDSEHAGRLAGGSVQQAPDHDLDEGDGVRVHAAGNCGPGDPFPGAFAGCIDAGSEPGGAVRTLEIWPAAGTAAREEPVLGKRRHRAGYVSRDHHRHGCRRMDGRAFQRSRGVRGVRAAGPVGDRIPDQPRR